jgi:hypothetical protein
MNDRTISTHIASLRFTFSKSQHDLPGIGTSAAGKDLTKTSDGILGKRTGKALSAGSRCFPVLGRHGYLLE